MPANGLLNDAIATLETRMISDTMAACNGNQSEAARQLGISRLGLIKKIGKIGSTRAVTGIGAGNLTLSSDRKGRLRNLTLDQPIQVQ